MQALAASTGLPEGLPEPVQPDGPRSRCESGRPHLEIPRLYKET
jgi:hypothetical protein